MIKKTVILFFAMAVLLSGICTASDMASRRLGNTGKRLGVIGLDIGTYDSNSRQAFSKAIKGGAIFISSSPFVEGSEKFVAENVGPSLKSKCMLSTRWRTDNDDGEEDFIRNFQQSIKNLNTNFIDCVILDDVKESRHIKRNSILNAFNKLKKEGKTKYIGVYVKKTEKESISKILGYILQKGDYDFVVLDYSTDNFNEIRGYIEAIGKKGLGVIVCGTVEDSLKNPELARRIAGRKKMPLEQAVIQWAVSSSKWISTIIVNPKSEEEMDLILKGGVDEEDFSLF